MYIRFIDTDEGLVPTVHFDSGLRWTAHHTIDAHTTEVDGHLDIAGHTVEVDIYLASSPEIADEAQETISRDWSNGTVTFDSAAGVIQITTPKDTLLGDTILQVLQRFLS